MNRREFLKHLALWYAGMAVAAPVFRLPAQALALPLEKPEIVVGRGQDYPALVKAVIRQAGGMERFVKKGHRVVIKPNIGWDRTPEQGANTHPLVVKTLVELALGAGARSVSVFDRTCNEERRCYQNSGIKPMLDGMKDRRVRCEFIDDRRFVPVTIARGKALTEWPFYKDALEADCYINVPVAKHHGLTGVTLGLKNIMGVIGGSRGLIHHRIDQNLADLNSVLRPDLTVVDATRILTKNGPQGGSLEDVSLRHTVFATTDPVAADAYGTTLFDLAPDAVAPTVAAYKMGLGEMALDKCRITEI